VKPDTLQELSRTHGTARLTALETLYHRFNHPKFRASDPVEFVWSFLTPGDREVAAWCAAALAYGRVRSIQQALADLNRRWEYQPLAFLTQASMKEQRQALRGFVYRWTRDHHLLAFLSGWAAVHYTRPVYSHLKESSQQNYRQSLVPVIAEMKKVAEGDPGHLLPDPAANSACKRLAMWLRWMVRKDHVDPGLWADHLSPEKLWIPLDTHMFTIARRLRLTRRVRPDAEAAMKITRSFCRLNPSDPIRYDFALTRLGMGLPTPGTADPVPPGRSGR